MGTPCEEGSFEEETILILQDAVKNSSRECAILDGYSSEYGHMLNGYKVLFDSRGMEFHFPDAEKAMAETGLNRTEFTFMVTQGRTVKGWTGMQE